MFYIEFSQLNTIQATLYLFYNAKYLRPSEIKNVYFDKIFENKQDLIQDVTSLVRFPPTQLQNIVSFQ